MSSSATTSASTTATTSSFSDITYDIKKQFNAQATLTGAKLDQFHKTNPSPLPHASYKHYKRGIDITSLEKFKIKREKFPSRINFENLSNIVYHPHNKEPGITQKQINLTDRQLINDFINHTPNMYNGLEPYRCALKREPIIPQSSYLSGLLSAKEIEVVKMGTTPKKPPPLPPAGPPDDYGKDKFAMKQYGDKMIKETYKEYKDEKNEKQQAIKDTRKRLQVPDIRKKRIISEEIKPVLKQIEKATIGEPVKKALEKIETARIKYGPKTLLKQKRSEVIQDLILKGEISSSGNVEKQYKDLVKEKTKHYYLN